MLARQRQYLGSLEQLGHRSDPQYFSAETRPGAAWAGAWPGVASNPQIAVAATTKTDKIL